MANPGIQVPYNFELKALEQLLSTVQRPGDYLVAGSLEAPMLGGIQRLSQFMQGSSDFEAPPPLVTGW